MKKLISFLGFCAYVVGSLGGLIYSLYCHKYLIAICVVALAVMAFPTFRKFIKELAS